MTSNSKKRTPGKRKLATEAEEKASKEELLTDAQANQDLAEVNIREDDDDEDDETEETAASESDADGDDEEDDDEASTDSDSSVYSELEDDDDEDSDEDEEGESEEDGGDDDNDDQDENEGEQALRATKGGKKLPKMSPSSADPSPAAGPASTAAPDEYAYDSSDEEDIRNTIGNIPVNWYDDYDHLGYDLDAQPVRKPKRGDELDHYLRRAEDGDAGVTVRDPLTGQDVVLSQAEVEAIRRVTRSKVPDGRYDLYADLVPWFSSQVLQTPVRDLPESKKSFLPSLADKKKVGRMVHAIKMGWVKTRAQKEKEKQEREAGQQRYYMLWKTDDQPEDVKRIHDLIPAPKMALPGHAESYNPPPEYLFSEREREDWESKADEPSRRKLQFIPAKHDSLRQVPAYKKFISERFERCLDLYLAPRARKMRLTIQPEDLLPQLPNPKDLQPFPTTCSLTFKGHKNMIRSLSVEPSGQFLASGCDDGTVRVWEIQTGYCMRTYDFGGVVRSVQWCPNKALSLLAVAVENKVVLIGAGAGDKVVVEQTDDLLKDEPEINAGYEAPERVKTAVTWSKPLKEHKVPKESLVVLTFFKQVKQLAWHGKGDYFSTVQSEGQNRSVLIHQLSRWRSQIPFSKAKGLVQCVAFHPQRPYLFVATQRHVRIYNLAKQELSKKLMTGARWISNIAVHPKGDNLLVSTYDKRVQWFDLDLSTMPYKVLKYHMSAVRQVAYHKHYPLFASCSDDASVIVSHGMVYSDLLQNPMIVPVKLLRGHTKYDDFGVMELVWHPTQPWLLSGGADGYIKLWT